MEKSSDEGLRRVIGVRALAANAVNLTLGAGIFGLPAVIAGYLGPSSFLAYLLCALLILMVLLCYIEIGSKITKSGGAYTYVETAFGPFLGFLTSTLYWFGYCIMADAAVANLFVDTLGILVPVLKEPVFRVSIIFLVFASLTYINVKSVSYGSSFVQIITIAKLVPLLIFVAVGVFFMKGENLVVEHWPTIGNLGKVSVILFFAFGGIEASLNASGEIKDPVRTVPRGILLGVFTILALYLLIQLVSQGVLGNELTNYESAPLAEVARRIMGSGGATLLLVGASISCLGLISGDILSSSRLPYAAARDGLLPALLTRVHPKYATPYLSIIFYGTIGFLVAVSGGFEQLAALAGSALLMIYLGVVLSTIKMRKVSAEIKSFKIPGGIVIPILAALSVLWFLSNLEINELIALAVYLAFFAVVYLIMKLIKRKNGTRST